MNTNVLGLHKEINGYSAKGEHKINQIMIKERCRALLWEFADAVVNLVEEKAQREEQE